MNINTPYPARTWTGVSLSMLTTTSAGSRFAASSRIPSTIACMLENTSRDRIGCPSAVDTVISVPVSGFRVIILLLRNVLTLLSLPLLLSWRKTYLVSKRRVVWRILSIPPLLLSGMPALYYCAPHMSDWHIPSWLSLGVPPSHRSIAWTFTRYTS